MEESSDAEPNIKTDKRHTTEVERLKLDAAQNVGVPASQHRQRQSPNRFTGYMALMRKCIVTKPSSFQEVVQEPTCVDAIDRKSTRLNSSHLTASRMPSSA